MTDGRKTGDQAKPHENTQNFRAGVTLWHPPPYHCSIPKAPCTPKPEVGKGRNCTGWGWVGRRRVTCNTLHLLASGTLLLLLLLSRLLFHQISFLRFVQALVQWLPHQRSFLIFPWDRDPRIQSCANTYLASFSLLALTSPWNDKLCYASPVSLPFSWKAGAWSSSISARPAGGPMQDPSVHVSG